MAGVVGRLDGTLGDVCEPIAVDLGHRFASPVGGVAGDGVEAEGGGETATDAVMVAADIELGLRADDVDDFVWAGSVADDIAEIPEDVEGSCGLERRR